MDEKIPNDENEPQMPEQAPVAPTHENPDAQVFSKWMAEYGRPALIGLAVAVVLLLGIQVWRGQKQSKAAAAVQALFRSSSPEELQQLASADPEAPTAPMALASAAAEFYAQNRYDEAMAAYQRFLSLYPGHLLAPDAAVGVAASLEAQDQFEEAAASYEAFARENPASSLRPQAVFGAARCLEQVGKFDEARALYEDFIAANPDSTWLSQAESGLLFLKKAERAKNLPAPVSAVPAAIAEAPASAEAPAPEAVAAAVAEAPAAEEAVVPAAETPAVEAPAPAVAEEKAAQVDSKPQKKKSSKKKKAAQPESGGEGAGEPAAE